MPFNFPKILFPALLSALPLTSSFGIAFYDIDQATVDNAGENVVLGNTSTYTPTGDSDLLSFRVSSGPNAGTTYSISDFISGVNPSSASINAPGLIQPAAYLSGASDPKFAAGTAFYTGSSNTASYLGHGARGMSFSTGINVTTKDEPTIIQFAATIKNVDALNDGVPDFIFGDVADNQSVDTIEYLNSNGEAILSATFGSSNWSSMGTHTIDRVLADGTRFNTDGTGVSSADNTTRGIALLAFELGDGDLTDLGKAIEGGYAAALAEVASIRITVLGEYNSTTERNEPKTDYSFIGVNMNAFDSPDFVAVPEPTFFAGLLGLTVLSAAVCRRKGRASAR